MKLLKYLIVVLSLSTATVSAEQHAYQPNAKEITTVLDTFHEAAANADETTYFNLMAEDFIFLGTDASERWTKETFSAFVRPYFSKGVGWRYVPTQQNVSFVSDSVAYFDEILEHEKYGTCRGSGVLVRVNEQWHLSQYNLSIPMPNDLAKSLVDQIKTHQIKE